MLYGNKTLKTLDLSANSIRNLGLRHLATAMRNNTVLQTLNLSKNGIKVDPIALTLKQNSTITELVLSNNKLDMQCAKQLASALKNNGTLQTLDVSRNFLYSQGVKSLAKLAKVNTSLQSLNLSQVQMTTKRNEDAKGNKGKYQHCLEGVGALGRALQSNQSLLMLNVSANKLGTMDSKLEANWEDAFRDAVTPFDKDADGVMEESELHSYIRRLGIPDHLILKTAAIFKKHSGFSEKGDDEIRVTIDGLVEYYRKTSTKNARDVISHFKRLGISYSHEGGISHLANALKRNWGITMLNLSNNRLGVEGANLVSEMLNENSIISSIVINSKALDVRYLKGIASEAKLAASSGRIKDLEDGSIKAISSFPSIILTNTNLTKKKWYYEVKIVHMGKELQFGWADASFDGQEEMDAGVGHDALSWAFDGQRRCKWHNNKHRSFGVQWMDDDVIGVAADIDNKTISFSINGDWNGTMGEAYAGIHIESGLRPALTLGKWVVVKVNLGASPFSFAPPSEEYGPVFAEVEGSGSKDSGSSTLRTLNLADSNLVKEDIMVLSAFVAKNTVVSVCNISGNKIAGYSCDNALKSVAHAITENASIVDLNVSGTHLDDTAVRMLCEALQKNAKIETINLSRNAFKDKGAMAVSIFIAEHRTLKYLDMSRIPMGAEGAKAFGKALKKNTSLTHISVANTELCGLVKSNDGRLMGAYEGDGLKEFLEALSESLSLRSVDLSGNYIGAGGEEAIEPFSEALKTNKSLLFLDISSNDLGHEGGAIVLAALEETSAKIMRFDVSNNAIGAGGAKAAARFLRKNMTLRTFGCANNKLDCSLEKGQWVKDTSGISVLASAIRAKKSLASFTFGDGASVQVPKDELVIGSGSYSVGSSVTHADRGCYVTGAGKGQGSANQLKVRYFVTMDQGMKEAKYAKIHMGSVGATLIAAFGQNKCR